MDRPGIPDEASARQGDWIEGGTWAWLGNGEVWVYPSVSAALGHGCIRGGGSNGDLLRINAEQLKALNDINRKEEGDGGAPAVSLGPAPLPGGPKRIGEP